MLLQAGAQRLSALHDAPQGSAALQAASDFVPACRAAALTADDDAQAIVQAAADWSTKLDAAIDTGASGGDPTVAVVQGLRSDISTLQHVDRFEELFIAVTDHAAEVYGDAWVDPTFRLDWLDEPPRNGADPYGFDALTLTGPPPMIELSIYPDGLGPAAYSALPWVMVHEAVCHVAARPIGTPDNASSFAEGFMDWAAAHFFRSWMSALNPPLAPMALDHQARFDPFVTRPTTAMGAARIQGRQAANTLMTWVETMHGKPNATARALVAALACQLNVVDGHPLEAKDAFVARIIDPSRPPGFETALLDCLEQRADPADLL